MTGSVYLASTTRTEDFSGCFSSLIPLRNTLIRPHQYNSAANPTKKTHKEQTIPSSVARRQPFVPIITLVGVSHEAVDSIVLPVWNGPILTLCTSSRIVMFLDGTLFCLKLRCKRIDLDAIIKLHKL